MAIRIVCFDVADVAIVHGCQLVVVLDTAREVGHSSNRHNEVAAARSTHSENHLFHPSSPRPLLSLVMIWCWRVTNIVASQVFQADPSGLWVQCESLGARGSRKLSASVPEAFVFWQTIDGSIHSFHINYEA
jgi:hypothetical protein